MTEREKALRDAAKAMCFGCAHLDAHTPAVRVMSPTESAKCLMILGHLPIKISETTAKLTVFCTEVARNAEPGFACNDSSRWEKKMGTLQALREAAASMSGAALDLECWAKVQDDNDRAAAMRTLACLLRAKAEMIAETGRALAAVIYH